MDKRPAQAAQGSPLPPKAAAGPTPSKAAAAAAAGDAPDLAHLCLNADAKPFVPGG